MTWILLCFEHLPMFATQEETHAMRHHNTVFHTVLKFLPWHVVDRLVERYRANKKVRRLTTQNQLVTLLYAQLAGAESLRAIEAGLSSHAARLPRDKAASRGSPFRLRPPAGWSLRLAVRTAAR